MTKQQQQRLMYNVFGSMMVRGYFKDQQKMVAVLKAIHYLLGSMEGLSVQECDDCLLYFFQEYAKGCRGQSITDSYIKMNMIPVVKDFPYVDMEWGMSILIAAKG